MRSGLAFAAAMGALALAIVLGGLDEYLVYVVNLTLINAVVAIGLMVLSGVAGLMSLGTAAVVALGAYGTGMLMTHLGMTFLPSALIAATVAAAVGTGLAAPALRLTGLHLGIATLAFGVIVVQVIGKGGAWTGGMSGLTLPPVTLFGWPINDETSRFWLVSPVFVAAVFATANLVRFKAGRAMLALRNREVTAQSLGVNVSVYKVIAFAYSSFLAGLSGGLLAAVRGYISVDDFTVWTSIYFFVMIAIGGMTRVSGAIVGAAVVTLLPELLRGFQDSANAVFGVVLMLAVIYMPGGITGMIAAAWSQLRPRSAAAAVEAARARVARPGASGPAR